MGDGVSASDAAARAPEPPATARGATAADWARALAAAAFVPALVFLLIPNRLLLRNLGHLDYSPRLVLLCAGAFAVVWLAWSPLFVFAARRRWCAALVRAWLFLGLALYFCAFARELVTDRLPGFWLTAVVEGLLGAAAAWIVLRAGLRTLTMATGAMALFLVGYTVTAHAVAYRQVRRAARERVDRARVFRQERQAPGAPSTAFPGNIYHVLLDGFQAEAYEMLRADDPTVELPGFTYYADFHGSYWLTTFSLSSLLTGRLVREGESVSQFQDEAILDGMWRALAESGINIWLYPYYTAHCAPYAVKCSAAARAEARRRGIPGAAAAGSHPAFLTGEESWLLDRAAFLLEPRTVQLLTARPPHGPPVPLVHRALLLHTQTVSLTSLLRLRPPGTSIEEQVPAAAMVRATRVNFGQMLLDEAQRPARGQYVFLHLITPHFPYLYDADCNRLAEEAPVEAQSYLAQAHCALRLIETLTHVLARLGRLDDALIVVHGDHGAFPVVAAQLVRHAPAYFTIAPDNPRIEGMANRLHAVDTLLFTYGRLQRPDVLAARARAPQWQPGPLDLPRQDWWRMEDWRNGEAVALRRHAALLVKFPGARTFSVVAGPANMRQLAPTMVRHAGLPVDAYVEPPLEPDRATGSEPTAFYVFDGVGHMAQQHVMARRTEPPPHFRVYERASEGWRERDPLPVAY